jgi:hypothetical protein
VTARPRASAGVWPPAAGCCRQKRFCSAQGDGAGAHGCREAQRPRSNRQRIRPSMSGPLQRDTQDVTSPVSELHVELAVRRLRSPRG